MRTQTHNPDHIRGRRAEERCVHLLLKIGYIARIASFAEDCRGVDVVVLHTEGRMLYLQVKSNPKHVGRWRRKHPDLSGICECVTVNPEASDARVITRLKIALAKIKRYLDSLPSAEPNPLPLRRPKP